MTEYKISYKSEASDLIQCSSMWFVRPDYKKAEIEYFLLSRHPDWTVLRVEVDSVESEKKISCKCVALEMAANPLMSVDMGTGDVGVCGLVGKDSVIWKPVTEFPKEVGFYPVIAEDEDGFFEDVLEWDGKNWLKDGEPIYCSECYVVVIFWREQMDLSWVADARGCE